MGRSSLGVLAVLFFSGPAMADRAACKTLAPVLPHYVQTIEGLYDSLKQGNMRPVLQNFDGEDKEKLLAMVEAGEALRPLMEAYIAASQDAAYQMQKCAR